MTTASRSEIDKSPMHPEFPQQESLGRAGCIFLRLAFLCVPILTHCAFLNIAKGAVPVHSLQSSCRAQGVTK